MGRLGQRILGENMEAEQLCNWLEHELFKLISFIGLQFLSNVVLVSTVQQSESAARAHRSPLSWISSPLRSAQSPECSAPRCNRRISSAVSAGQGIRRILMSVPMSQSTPPPWSLIDFLIWENRGAWLFTIS